MMTPSDLTQIVVLGTAVRGPTSLPQIIDVARTLAPLDWQPTLDTIEAAVDAAVEKRLLEIEISPAQSGSVLRTTELGQRRILAILRTPLPKSTGGFVRACLSAKVCFLDRLPLLERGDNAEELADVYRHALDVLHRLNTSPDPSTDTALRHIRDEIVRLDSEIAWLEAMASWRPMRLAAE